MLLSPHTWRERGTRVRSGPGGGRVGQLEPGSGRTVSQLISDQSGEQCITVTQ